MNSGEDKFFYHFMAGAVLAMALVVAPLIWLLLWALWNAGLVFLFCLALGLSAFGWATHRIALFIQTKDWL